MLDTGVDVPEVVNLVFFKPVRSKVKFHQMVGRGTRLCRNLFGPGVDKTCFLVFDLCGNFEYFGQPLGEEEGGLTASLTARLVRHRLALVALLDAAADRGDGLATVRRETLDALHRHVAAMNRENFLVRPHRAAVERLADRARWEGLTADDRETVEKVLAALPSAGPSEALAAREFDLLMLRLEVALLRGAKAFVPLAREVRTIAAALAEQAAIPMVRARIELVESVRDEGWWTDVTVPMLEEVRKALRDLATFVEKKARRRVYTDFEDALLLDEMAESVAVPVWGDESLYLYREKVERHIKAHRDHLTVAKLRRNLPLTEADLTELERLVYTTEAGESRERFAERVKQPLPAFIRRLVGLDREAAKAAFGDLVAGRTLTVAQTRFIDQIINHLTKNGAMDPGQLYDPPFTDIHAGGLEGVFPAEEDADRVIAIVREVNRNGGVDDEDERRAG